MTKVLTLTGAGGCGKTRLVLEVARDLVRIYPDGVWLAELASLPDHARVPQAVAAALGVPERAGARLRSRSWSISRRGICLWSWITVSTW